MLKDLKILEILYGNILLNEDAASTKAQAINMLVRKEVGDDIFKYKNKPENKQTIDSAIQKNQPIIDEYANFIIEKNPKDKNLSSLLKLIQFYIEQPEAKEIIKQEYEKYLKLPSIAQNPFLNIAKTFTGWTQRIHSEEADLSDAVNKKEFKTVSDDPNKVYEDDQVAVFLSNNTKNPKQSVLNCVHYGKGSGLCISSSSARYHYHNYRKNRQLTTYFVFLKTRKHFMLIDATGDNENPYEYNPMFIPDPNNNEKLKPSNEDTEATEQEIKTFYPELKKPFEIIDPQTQMSEVFAYVPLSDEEKNFYNKYYDKSIHKFSTDLTELKTYIDLNGISVKQWNIIKDNENLDVLINLALTNLDDDIPDDILSKYPELKKRYWNIVRKNLTKEIIEWGDDDEFDLTQDEAKIFNDVYDSIKPEDKINFDNEIEENSKIRDQIFKYRLSHPKSESDLNKFVLDYLKSFKSLINASGDFGDKLTSIIKAYLLNTESGIIPDFLYEELKNIEKRAIKDKNELETSKLFSINILGRIDYSYINSFVTATSNMWRYVAAEKYVPYPKFPFDILNDGYEKLKTINNEGKIRGLADLLQNYNKYNISYIDSLKETSNVPEEKVEEEKLKMQNHLKIYNDWLFEKLSRSKDFDNDWFDLINYKYTQEISEEKIPDSLMDLFFKKHSAWLGIDEEGKTIYKFTEKRQYETERTLDSFSVVMQTIILSDSPNKYIEYLVNRMPIKTAEDFKFFSDRYREGIVSTFGGYNIVIKLLNYIFDGDLKLVIDTNGREVNISIQNFNKSSKKDQESFKPLINFLDYSFGIKPVNKMAFELLEKQGYKNAENFVSYIVYLSKYIGRESRLDNILGSEDALKYKLEGIYNRLENLNEDLYKQLISNKTLLSKLCYWIEWIYEEADVYAGWGGGGLERRKIVSMLKEKYFNHFNKNFNNMDEEGLRYIIKSPTPMAFINFIRNENKVNAAAQIINDKEKSLEYIINSSIDFLLVRKNKYTYQQYDIGWTEDREYPIPIYYYIAKKHGVEIFQKAKDIIDTSTNNNWKKSIEAIKKFIFDTFENPENDKVKKYFEKLLSRFDEELEKNQITNESFKKFFSRKLLY